MAKMNRSAFASLIADTFPHWQFLADADQDWQNVVEDNPSANSEYLTTTIHYHNAYLENAIDCSIVIYDQQHAIAVWPLTLNNLVTPQILQSNCKSIIPPLFAQHAGKKQQKKIYQQCLALIKAYAESIQADGKVCYRPSTDVLWQRTLAPFAKQVSYQQYLYTDLSLPLNELRNDFRKSYRALINKALKLWQCEVLENLSDSQLEEFRQFHIKTAGKETRSLRSWLLQQQMVNKGEAFYISMRNQDDKLIGAALFNLSPAQASYSVGVYDRELFDQPLGHAAQWCAMEYMQSIGIKRYFLGNRHHQFEHPTPNEKESAIGFFKEGFSNRIELEAQATLRF